MRADDTGRYVEWLKRNGKPVREPHEAVQLRLGDWGFFVNWRPGTPPGVPLDRAGLDRSGHQIQPTEEGDWHGFLGTPGLDAEPALQRIAYVFGARALNAPTRDNPRITPPRLQTAADGSITFQGWLGMGNPPRPWLLTIEARPSATRISWGSAAKR